MGHQFTRQDIADIEAEIERRKLEERPRLIEDVKEARSHGDLSENFEYYAAKREKNRNESRIRYLDRLVRTAEIIEDASAEDEVGIGDEVTVLFEEDGFEDTYILLTTLGADSLNNKISIESPIGRAVKGRKIGDKCTVTVSKDNHFSIIIKDIKKH